MSEAPFPISFRHHQIPISRHFPQYTYTSIPSVHVSLAILVKMILFKGSSLLFFAYYRSGDSFPLLSLTIIAFVVL